jgi:hypothetical protein
MRSVGLFVVVLAAGLTSGTVFATEVFSYGFRNVFDCNADNYLVSSENVRKYLEEGLAQSVRGTYWGPDEANEPATLTYHFEFGAPASQIFLQTPIFSARTPMPGNAGSVSLWASGDGISWQMLVTDPPPVRHGQFWSVVDYSSMIPSSFLGGTSFWLQVRMEDTESSHHLPFPMSHALSGFALSSGCGSTAFQLKAMLVPEPTPSALCLLGALATVWAFRTRSRR